MPSTVDRPRATVPDTGAYASGPHPAWLDTDWSQYLRWHTIAGRAVNVLDTGPHPDRPGEAPLVFIHGHSACWQHWLEQLPHFMRTHRCIALDLPGFGRSEMPADGISMSGYARVVDEVLQQLGVAAACVVGNSMGGFVAAELAIRFPQRVERLVLVAAAGLAGKYIGLPTEFIRHPSGAAAGRVLFGLGGVPDGLATALARRRNGRRLALGFVTTHPRRLHPALVCELIGGTGKPGAAPAAVELATYDFSDRVPDIACPTLIVWGDTDNLVPVTSAGHYEDLIPDARKVIYADTGHVPMLERPERFNADLAAFLAE
ncbi:alpha/beta hydrolase [Paraconexibacter antarcticus]|uniref:Alpha/beta hydrolase n=1 Tax=Paraconexibacter antarcticus TaxID=2949664 RepID=A0ABY5DW36_9ACTN|nr:alpha/beta hydrolase [Paraconexibacter antarcticus]UTI65296.1 alpha/beta hydrolase [Paraconexibacter antarcticus]